MLYPGRNIIGGVHPLWFKGPIPCMLDIELADDMGGISEDDGIADIDDDSDDRLGIDGIGDIECAAFETIIPGIEPAIGSLMDIRGMEVIALELLPAVEVVEVLVIDIEGIEEIEFAGSMTLLCGIEPVI